MGRVDASTMAAKAVGVLSDPKKALASRRKELISLFSNYELNSPEAQLAQRAGCDDAQTITFALCVGAELSPEASNALAAFNNLISGHLTVGNLREISSLAFGGESVVGPSSALRRSHLIDVAEGNSFANRPVLVAPAVMWALTGDPHPDPDLPALSKFFYSEDCEGNADSLLVLGSDPTRRLEAATERMPLKASLVAKNLETQAHWSAAIREATVANANLVIELDSGLSEIGLQYLDKASHLPLALLSNLPLDIDGLPDRRWTELSEDKPVVSEQEVIDVVGQSVGNPLTADQLRRLTATLPVVGGDVSKAIRRLADQRLFKFGSRITPQRSWPDLVIPETQMRELEDLADRFRYSDGVRRNSKVGRFVPPGLLALLSGVSGTGKTLAAEVLAGELNLELVKIDLSTLVSKYIGETEKNLDQVFDAAGFGGALLLFDEGDAIFGQRSPVSDARDRYANMEVSYLLQRVETFSGFVLITTNLAGNVDSAFRRRLQAVIELPEPSADAQRAIWEIHLGADECDAEVDFDRLSELKLTGGQIRNAAVSAALLSAASNQKISESNLELAIKRELKQQGRLADSLKL